MHDVSNKHLNCSVQSSHCLLKINGLWDMKRNIENILRVKI
ncbi:hypothetical protein EDC48_11197 [Gibbsiella quercinecans]|nr:hypothetical protein EDC48_11197 [Gibbsiella quercinecans]